MPNADRESLQINLLVSTNEFETLYETQKLKALVTVSSLNMYETMINQRVFAYPFRICVDKKLQYLAQKSCNIFYFRTCRHEATITILK